MLLLAHPMTHIRLIGCTLQVEMKITNYKLQIADTDCIRAGNMQLATGNWILATAFSEQQITSLDGTARSVRRATRCAGSGVVISILVLKIVAGCRLQVAGCRLNIDLKHALSSDCLIETSLICLEVHTKTLEKQFRHCRLPAADCRLIFE